MSEQHQSVHPTITNVIHLGGHPLPPLIELSTSKVNQTSSSGYTDLFLLSLQRPILLFVYPDPNLQANQSEEKQKTIDQLKRVQDTLQSFQKVEKDLEVFGFSTQNSEDQIQLAKQHKLESLSFLSDSKLEFTKALELPKLIISSQGETLERITLLLREGQITQFQYPILQPALAAQEAFKLLNAGKATITNTTTSDTANLKTTEMSMNEEYFDNERGVKLKKSEIHERVGSLGIHNEEWRNSLVAIDNETGEFLGVVAHNVSLSSTNSSPLMMVEDEDGVEDGEDENLTPEPEQQKQPQMIERAMGRYTDFNLNQKPAAYQFNSTMIRYNNNNQQNKLINAPLAIYHDPDVRPKSREGSILGEDTFAPPPVPDKPEFLKEDLVKSDEEDVSESEMGFSDGEAIDGQIRTRAKHVEAHRPDLLRDDEGIEQGDCTIKSDVSGSTIGGPVVQIWRKARGGKEGEKKRRMKKEQKQKQKQREQVKARTPLSTLNGQSINTLANISPIPSTPTPAPPPHSITKPAQISSLMPPSIETVNQVRAQRGEGRWRKRDQIRTSQIQSIEDRVWQSALENGSLPIDAPYTHLPFQSTPKNKTSNILEESDGSIEMKKKGEVRSSANSPFVMQGNSVLLEFLAGSKIVANIIHENANNFASSTTNALSNLTQKPNPFTPTSVEPIPQTGVLRYIPVLPDHLLWFFGLNGETTDEVDQQSHSQISNPDMISMGNQITRMVSTMAISVPTQLLQIASQSVSSVWHYGLPNLESLQSAGNWIGSNLTSYLPFTSNSKEDSKQSTSKYLQDYQDYTDEDGEEDLHITHPGDEDASEWEWKVLPTTSLNSRTLDQEGEIQIEENWKNTPRPVYRRKRPIPSVQNGFQVRQKGDSRIPETSNSTTTITHGNLTIHRNPSDRYSIIHFDHQGIPRQALLHPGTMSTSL